MSITNAKDLIKLASEFNILYLEDEDKLREEFVSFLKKLFKNVYSGENGAVGLKLFDKYDVDIILTDINMPEIDGLKFAEIIKEKNKDIPIVLITAYTDTAFFIKAIDMRIDKFLIKPINGENFFKSIIDILTTLKVKKDKIKFENLSKNLSKELEIKSKELNLFKDDVISIFTHELKTPLHAIINFSDYIHRNLQKNLTDKKIDKMIDLSEKIKSNGLAQFSLIETLLEVSKYKTGKIILNEIEFEPKIIINSIIKRYKTMYKKHTTCELDSIKINGDQNAFIMIFENFYSNALKYADSKIHIILKETEENSFILSVEDDGKGIDEEDKKIVFNQFEQIDKKYLNRVRKGTGLGLYLAKLISDSWNKEVYVNDSSLLGGAKFILKGLKK